MCAAASRPGGPPARVVATVRDALAPLAAAFFQHPSDRFDLVGVTGTNGKTTTTYMLEAIYRAAGFVPGVLGTVEVGWGTSGGRPSTTPRPPTSSGSWPRWPTAGVQAAAMGQPTAWPCAGSTARFKAAIFTNLTQDHLDFHADLDDYWLASGACSPRVPPLAVVNLRGRPPRAPAGQHGRDRHRDLWHRQPERRLAGHRRHRLLEGTGFRLRSPAGSRPVRLRLAGQFNAVNALGALAAADAIGIDLDTTVAGLEALAGVPGRFERVDAGQPFTVLVDYAHTPTPSTTSSGRRGRSPRDR